MSAEGIETVKIRIRNLIMEAAQDGLLEGDEPLTVVTATAVKMIAEVRDPRVRDHLVNNLTKKLPVLVNYARSKGVSS